MDLKRCAIPPLVIAAVATIIYGFDVFDSLDSFALETIAAATVIPRQQYPRLSAEKLEAVKLAKAVPDSVQVIDILKTKVANTAISPAISLTAGPAVVLGSSVTAPTSMTPHRPIAEQDAVLVEESEPNLSENSNDSVEGDTEPSASVTPSMTTQATPIEMSDDGQIEPASPDTGS
jgi:hypothetical protein